MKVCALCKKAVLPGEGLSSAMFYENAYFHNSCFEKKMRESYEPAIEAISKNNPLLERLKRDV
jgi:hypothetical protein